MRATGPPFSPRLLLDKMSRHSSPTFPLDPPPVPELDPLLPLKLKRKRVKNPSQRKMSIWEVSSVEVMMKTIE